MPAPSSRKEERIHASPPFKHLPLVDCSLPKPSAASCTVVKDYLSLINVARSLGPKKGAISIEEPCFPILKS